MSLICEKFAASALAFGVLLTPLSPASAQDETTTPEKLVLCMAMAAQAINKETTIKDVVITEQHGISTYSTRVKGSTNPQGIYIVHINSIALDATRQKGENRIEMTSALEVFNQGIYSSKTVYGTPIIQTGYLRTNPNSDMPTMRSEEAAFKYTNENIYRLTVYFDQCMVHKLPAKIQRQFDQKFR